MENQIKINNGEFESIGGEEEISRFNFQYGMSKGNILVVVTKAPKDSNGEEYFNVFIIDDLFKIDYLNCLKEQIPMEAIENPKQYFNKMFCEMEALKHYLWREYSLNSEVLSFSIEAIRA